MKFSHCRPHVLAIATLLAVTAAAPAMAGQVYLNNLSPTGHYNRFIVQYRPGSEPTQAPQPLKASLDAAAGNVALPTALRQRLGLKPLRAMAVRGARVVATDAALDRSQTETLMRRIAADPNVEYVQVDGVQRVLSTPNDPQLAKQWHYADDAFGIRAPTAWNTATGRGIVVAVIDSGVYASHPDLAPNLLPGYDFVSSVKGYDDCLALMHTSGCGGSADGDGRDSNPEDSSKVGHGTHVAGTVAAVGNNGLGGLGVAYEAKILPLRVSGTDGMNTDSDTIDAIVWASGGAVSGVPANPNRADVINLSVGATGLCSDSPAYQAAINQAVANGTVVIAAGGNSDNDAATFTPASCNNVVSVGSTDQKGVKASSSAWNVTLSAPGVSVLSTVDSNKYGTKSGTSMASPHVAGVAALIQSAAPAKLSPAKVVEILKSTARPISAKNCAKGCGAGIIDAAAAVEAARKVTP
ncbi:S8 family serine peptidase [Lysobacter enzymogenes]|uniref:S8 family serine peptidase n=1 Tax=Lysobacter enzymogenes TaxID=69 RepID=UPI00384F9C1B